jgi:hypothetical protein
MRHEPVNAPAIPTEDTALRYIVDYMIRGPRQGEPRYGYTFYLKNAIDPYLLSQGVQENRGLYCDGVSAPFLSAAWSLCRRGILRPTVERMNGQVVPDGGGYSITAFGRDWLEQTKKGFDYIPLEPGRLAELLTKYAGKFGRGFHQRAQDAVRSHEAHAYFACCAMCGAGAESIFLALAIAKNGDEEETLKTYIAKNGRGRLEANLVGQQPPHIQSSFKAFTGLLKYWRDLTAHGQESEIEEVEAFTSVLLLLRFAQFASDHWEELTR